MRRDMMRYSEYPPGPALAGLVACFWTSSVLPPAARAAFSHRVLPDNCVDILWQDTGAAFAVGMMSRFIDVPSAGPVRTAAVRFLPGAASLFLGPCLPALADARADLDQLWPRTDAERLGDALWSADLDDRARLGLIESALLARLALAPGAGAGLARQAVAAIESSGGALRVEALADTLGVSRQHLSARFREQVGLSPKLFARITRFRHATAAARAPSASPAAGPAAPDWADLALACGYFDQSHLIRDFHDFAGAAPDAWLASR
ncbi:DUF6597 domain-containing transcriptional factor [Pseudoduganella sp. UC29_106]|uniref:DUF6597 domain-containing transcriptional factor n=1 Tax=Pseudoduganella sp. UC29_106 TaxID=3374553 RepID=UPI003756E1AE